jgi:hypothetical protein
MGATFQRFHSIDEFCRGINTIPSSLLDTRPVIVRRPLLNNLAMYRIRPRMVLLTCIHVLPA